MAGQRAQQHGRRWRDRSGEGFWDYGRPRSRLGRRRRLSRCRGIRCSWLNRRNGRRPERSAQRQRKRRGHHGGRNRHDRHRGPAPNRFRRRRLLKLPDCRLVRRSRRLLLPVAPFFRRLKKPPRLFQGQKGLFFLPRGRLVGFRRKDPLCDLDQAVDMLIEGRPQRVEPMQAAEAQPQGAGWTNVLDAKRDDGGAGVERRHDLVEDVVRGVRRRRQDHDDEFRLADRLDDRGAPVPEADVARRDPAADARFLQPVADSVGHGLVGDGVADENVVGQAALACEPERSRPKAIQCQNSAKAKAIRRAAGRKTYSRG